MKTVHISCALGVGGWRSRSREIRRAVIRQQHQATRHSVVQQEAIGLRNTTVIAQILKQARSTTATVPVRKRIVGTGTQKEKYETRLSVMLDPQAH